MVTKPEEGTTTTGVAATAPTSPPTTSAQARVGATLRVDGNDGEQLRVTLVQLVDPATGKQFFKPEGRYVAIQLRLENIGPSTVEDFPTNSAQLIDSQGQQYNPTYAETTAGQGFSGGVKLSPGDTRLGVVTFDLPAGMTPARFRYTLNSGFGGQTGEWLLS